MRLLFAAISTVALTTVAGACKDADSPRIESWGGPSDVQIESVHGVVACPLQSGLALSAIGIPHELRETIDGVTKSFGVVQPFPFTLDASGALPTRHTQNSLALWRWDVPGEDSGYGYIVVSSNGTDPIFYEPCDEPEDSQ